MTFEAIKLFGMNLLCFPSLDEADRHRSVLEASFEAHGGVVIASPEKTLRISSELSTARSAMAAGGKKNARAVITPEGEFPSVKDAAIHYGMSATGMMARCKSKHWEGFQYKEKGQ